MLKQIEPALDRFGERNRHLLAGAMYPAYAKWCAENDVTPMTPQSFGRGVPWKKEKTGGTIYYTDAAIADDYMFAAPALRLVARN